MALDNNLVKALEALCTVRRGEAFSALDKGFHDNNLDAKIAAFPETTGQVQALVKLCALYAVPIVTHGGRTGLAGAGASKPGQLIVDMSRMNAIEDVDTLSGTVVAQAGATLQVVQERCAQAGLTPGIDLAARGSATIGGMISTNAGGMEAFRCGVMRHRVLGLEAVMPDGSLFSDMTRVTKANEGLDIKHLLIGAEGRLGIVTRAVLKLEQVPGATATAIASCASAQAAVQGFYQLRRRGDLLRAEVMWRNYAMTVAEALGLSDLLTFCEAPLYVLFEAGGATQSAARETLEAGLLAAVEAGHVSDAVFAQSGRQEADMWRIREESWEVEKAWPGGLWYDVSLPLDRLDEYASGLEAAIGAMGADMRLSVMGHLGDGNLHITVSHAGGGTPDKMRVDAVVFAGIKECGGSISAEHGIGIEKMQALLDHGDGGRLAAARLVKQVFDPHNLMNPDKVLL